MTIPVVLFINDAWEGMKVFIENVSDPGYKDATDVSNKH